MAGIKQNKQNTLFLLWSLNENSRSVVVGSERKKIVIIIILMMLAKLIITTIKQ